MACIFVANIHSGLLFGILVFRHSIWVMCAPMCLSCKLYKNWINLVLYHLIYKTPLLKSTWTVIRFKCIIMTSRMHKQYSPLPRVEGRRLTYECLQLFGCKVIVKFWHKWFKRCSKTINMSISMCDIYILVYGSVMKLLHSGNVYTLSLLLLKRKKDNTKKNWVDSFKKQTLW